MSVPDPSPTATRAAPAADRGSPWLRLPGALPASADPRSLILAVLGLILTRVGLSATGSLLLEHPAGIGFDRRIVTGTVDTRAWDAWLGMSAWMVADPWFVLIRPVFDCLGLGGGNAAFAHSAFGIAWALLVWGVIGGAIGRIAVVRASGAIEGIGLLTAVRFALRRIGALVGAPAGPLVAVAVLAIPGALLGLMFRSGSPGDLRVAGTLAIVPLLLAVPSALLLIGLLACWPLMVLTVAAEGEDGFEAISRASSYLSRRPGHYAAAVAASWAIGAVGVMLVGAFAGLVIALAAWSLALGGPDFQISGAFEYRAPIIWSIIGEDEDRLRELTRIRDLTNDALPTTFGERGYAHPVVGRGFPISHQFWLRAVGLVAYAWAFSYFWSAFARIYLLLRREVDGTSWHDVYRPEEDAEPFAPDPTRPEAETERI